MNLSEHFTLEEAVLSIVAERKEIDNTPNAEQIENMKEQARGMELVREFLGGLVIIVLSWFRCLKLNSAIKGSKTSAHLDGYATDFTCSAFGTPREVCLAIMNSGIKYDQLILEFDAWVHISFAPAMRQMNLTIDREGTRHGIG